MEDLATTLLPDLAKGASKDAVLVILIWYMLKDVKKTLAEMGAKIDTNATASATMTIHLQYAKQQIDEARATIALLQNELKAVWRVIGNRPEDKAG